MDVSCTCPETSRSSAVTPSSLFGIEVGCVFVATPPTTCPEQCHRFCAFGLRRWGGRRHRLPYDIAIGHFRPPYCELWNLRSVSLSRAACTCNTVAISLCILLSRSRSSLFVSRFALAPHQGRLRPQGRRSPMRCIRRLSSANRHAAQFPVICRTARPGKRILSRSRRRSVFTQPGPKAAVTGIRPRRQLSEDELPSAPMWRQRVMMTHLRRRLCIAASC